MTIKHFLAAFAIATCTLLGFTACNDEDYAPISIELISGTGQLENHLLKIDAFSTGEAFYIMGGNGRYVIENKNEDVVDYRYDGHTLTFIPVGVGKATVIISDIVGNRMTLNIEVKNHTAVYKVTSLDAKAYGKNMTMGEVETLNKQIVNESLVKIGGDITFTYTNQEQSLGSITIHPTPSGRPISGIFRQERKFNEAKVPYLEFTITFADNRVVVWELHSNKEGAEMLLQENVLDMYKGIYPQLEKATLTYTITF